MLGRPGLEGPESRIRRQKSDGLAAPVIHASDDGDAYRGERNLNDQLDPVNAASGRNPEGRGDERAYQGRNDTHDEREPYRNILPARRHNPAQDTDDQPDDHSGDEPSHLHVRPPSIQRAFVRQFAISDYPVVVTERWA